uniref:MATE family efflux transporter n=1 Tax=Desertifilum tharense IPPAS B-1220 TaxID=1781255 RepID=A0ACD5GNM3_9CYAN
MNTKKPLTLRRQVIRLATPVVAQSILNTLVLLVDRAMLGYHASESLYSMQINGLILWALLSVLGAFSIGSMALVGRAVGSNDPKLASAAARSSLFLAVTIGIVAAIALHFGLPLLLAIFPAAGDNVQAAAAAYIGVIIPIIPLMLLGAIAVALLQAAGNTRTPFFVALFANGVNIVLNYALIFGNWGAPALGVRGAAMGTAIAIALKAAILLAVLIRPHGAITLRGWGGEWQALVRIFWVSAPAFGEKLIQHLGFFGFITMIGALGEVAMAANQALISIEAICFESADGIGIAAAVIVAQQLGAGRPNSAARGARAAAIMGLILLGSCGALFVLIPQQLLQAFTPDARIISVALPCLAVAAVAQPFMAMATILGESLRGAGDTRTALGVSLLGWFAVRLIATYVLAFPLHLGLLGVWLGSTLDWVVRTLVLTWILSQGKWQKVKV